MTAVYLHYSYWRYYLSSECMFILFQISVNFARLLSLFQFFWTSTEPHQIVKYIITASWAREPLHWSSAVWVTVHVAIGIVIVTHKTHITITAIASDLNSNNIRFIIAIVNIIVNDFRHLCNNRYVTFISILFLAAIQHKVAVHYNQFHTRSTLSL